MSARQLRRGEGWGGERGKQEEYREGGGNQGDVGKDLKRYKQRVHFPGEV